MINESKIGLLCDNAMYPGHSHVQKTSSVSLNMVDGAVCLYSDGSPLLGIEDCKAIRGYMDSAIKAMETIREQVKDE